MQAEILGTDDDVVGVKVVDPRGHRHLIEIDTKNDANDFHGQDAYPRDESQRSAEENRIISQVHARGRFEAHKETQYDIIRSGWVPEQLERGITTLERLPVEEFDNRFEAYYQALLNPASLRERFDITADAVYFDKTPRIALVIKSVCIDEQHRIVDDLPLFVFYSTTESDTNHTAGPDPSCPGETTEIPLMLPPFDDHPEEFTYPEDFRGLLINNLGCQIRDIYRNMGEEPPDQYDIAGFGKPNINYQESRSVVTE